MLITTDDSEIDTHIGLFGSTLGNPLFCYDDPVELTEFVEFQSTAGQQYNLQVGACWDGGGSTRACGPDLEGAVSVFAFSAAVNDGRAQAAALPTGQLTAGNNFIATEEPGEPTVCSSDRGVSPYGRTVWYRWSSPGPGTAVFTATGFDTVLAVYAAGSNAPLRCDDDPVLAGPSRIALPVGPGEYFVQVAGYGFHATSAQGFFDVSAEFTPNPDRDGDGTANGADCQPDNPAVHPGAVDIPLNGVDEDCSGADAGSPDRDGDGSPNAADCQPDNAAVRPGAKEIPKNGIDDDCVNGDAPYPRLVSEPVLSTTRHNRYWNIRKIRVRRVPAGAHVELRCRGGSAKGCPFSTRILAARRGSGDVDVTPKGIARRKIRRGVVLEIRVVQPRTIGVVRRYLFNRLRRAATEQDRCLIPGNPTPQRKC